MNIQAVEFSPSNEFRKNTKTIDTALLSTYLKTDSQIADAFCILAEWDQSPTLSSLMTQ